MNVNPSQRHLRELFSDLDSAGVILIGQMRKSRTEGPEITSPGLHSWLEAEPELGLRTTGVQGSAAFLYVCDGMSIYTQACEAHLRIQVGGARFFLFPSQVSCFSSCGWGPTPGEMPRSWTIASHRRP